MNALKRIFSVLFLIVIGCDTANLPTGTNAEYVYQQPEQVDDSWETSTLEAEAVDAQSINNMMHTILTNDYDFLKCIIIARNGKLIFEEYFNHTQHSMLTVMEGSKSSSSPRPIWLL